ncbi:hypothetical protein WCLP8_2780026 [uncultured Gammaproteobacteria bacterium]
MDHRLIARHPMPATFAAGMREWRHATDRVLYPAPLRDLLMRLALTDLFRAKWTDAIHSENSSIFTTPAKTPHLTSDQ